MEDPSESSLKGMERSSFDMVEVVVVVRWGGGLGREGLRRAWKWSAGAVGRSL